MTGSPRLKVAIAAMTLVLVVPLLVAMGNNQDGSGDDDAWAMDARSYAADVGVSFDEALRRLKLQDEIGKLGAPGYRRGGYVWRALDRA